MEPRMKDFDTLKNEYNDRSSKRERTVTVFIDLKDSVKLKDEQGFMQGLQKILDNV